MSDLFSQTPPASKEHKPSPLTSCVLSNAYFSHSLLICHLSQHHKALERGDLFGHLQVITASIGAKSHQFCCLPREQDRSTTEHVILEIYGLRQCMCTWADVNIKRPLWNMMAGPRDSEAAEKSEKTRKWWMGRKGINRKLIIMWGYEEVKLEKINVHKR